MKNSTPLRIGIIGGGGIATNHISGFRQHPDVEVVALAEINPERREWMAKEYELSAFGDYKELLQRNDIDAVSIALPNFLHAQVAIEALRAGKHVFLEKPMATRYADALEVSQLAKKNGLKVMVGQNVRFSPETQAMHQAVASGELGSVFHTRIRRIRQMGIPTIGSWFTRKQTAGGGCLYDLGVHILDAALFVLGNFEIDQVMGSTSSHFGNRGLGEGDTTKSKTDENSIFDVEDFANAMIRFKNGSTLQLDCSWATHIIPKSEVTQEYLGEEASLIGNPPVLVRHFAEPEEAEVWMKRFPPQLAENRCVHFVDYLLDRVESAVPLEQSLMVQKILDAIYKSSETKSAIRI